MLNNMLGDQRWESLGKFCTWEMVGDKDTYWSEGFYTLHGIDATMTKPSTEIRLALIYRDDLSKYNTAVQDSIASGKPYELKHRIQRPDGSLVPVISRGQAIKDNASGITRIFGVIIDVSPDEDAQIAREHRDVMTALNSLSNISFTDQKGRIVDANENFIRTSGHARENVVGQYHKLLDSGLHSANFWGKMWSQILSGNPWRSEIRNRARNGSLFWVDTTIAPLNNGQGDYDRFLTIQYDITRRKETERALANANLRLVEIMRFAGIGSLTNQEGSKEIVLHREFTRLLQRGNTELVLELEDFIQVHVVPADASLFQRMLTDIWHQPGRKRATETFQVTMVDTTGLRIRMSGRVFRRGSTAYAFFQDLSTLDSALRAVLKNKHRYQLLYNHLPSMYFTVDSALVVRLVNESGARHLGYEQADLIGQSVLGVFPAELHERVRNQIRTCFLEPSRSHTWVIHKITKNGEQILVREVAWLEEHLEAEKVLNILCEDISESERMSLELQEAKQDADRANRAKSEFLANMSHDMRTPLNGIMGFADLLANANVGTTEREYAGLILRSSRMLLNLVDDLLDLAKLESGRLAIVLEPVNLVQLCQEVCEMLQARVKEKGLRLTMQVDPSIPGLVQADRVRLKQILINLLTNATKFTERGAIDLKIEIVPDAQPYKSEPSAPKQRHNDHFLTIRFSVTDTGIGISQSNRAKIFEAFGQVDPASSRNHGGAGLGLTITNALLKLMSSSLELDSNPGTGSSFYFVIKLEIATAISGYQEDSPHAMLDRNAKGNRDKWSNQTILIVDDNDVNLLLTHRMLNKLIGSVEVLEAKDGRTAIDMFLRYQPSLILMDIQMPGLDGIQTVAEIRKIEANSNKDHTMHCTIVGLSADAYPATREKALKIGFDDFVSKPVNLTDIQGILFRWEPG